MEKWWELSHTIRRRIGTTVNDASDQSLIARCLGGQTEAFGLLVDRYQHRLYGALVHISGSADLARDYAQDAFLQAFEKLGSFRGESAFYSWLFRIALNVAISARRKTHRATASIDAIREASGQEPEDIRTSSSPWHEMHVADRKRLVQKALAEIPDEYRTALVMKEIDDLKYEEIASILDIPLGTVRSRIHRGRVELRAKLQGVLRAEET